MPPYLQQQQELLPLDSDSFMLLSRDPFSSAEPSPMGLQQQHHQQFQQQQLQPQPSPWGEYRHTLPPQHQQVSAAGAAAAELPSLPADSVLSTPLHADRRIRSHAHSRSEPAGYTSAVITMAEQQHPQQQHHTQQQHQLLTANRQQEERRAELLQTRVHHLEQQLHSQLQHIQTLEAQQQRPPPPPPLTDEVQHQLSLQARYFDQCLRDHLEKKAAALGQQHEHHLQQLLEQFDAQLNARPQPYPQQQQQQQQHAMDAQHAEEVRDLRRVCDGAVSEARELHRRLQEEGEALRRHVQAAAAAEDQHQQQVAALHSEHNQQLMRGQEAYDKLQQEHAAALRKHSFLEQEHAALTAEHQRVCAEALRVQGALQQYQRQQQQQAQQSFYLYPQPQPQQPSLLLRQLEQPHPQHYSQLPPTGLSAQHAPAHLQSAVPQPTSGQSFFLQPSSVPHAPGVALLATPHMMAQQQQPQLQPQQQIYDQQRQQRLQLPPLQYPPQYMLQLAPQPQNLSLQPQSAPLNPSWPGGYAAPGFLPQQQQQYPQQQQQQYPQQQQSHQPQPPLQMPFPPQLPPPPSTLPPVSDRVAAVMQGAKAAKAEKKPPPVKKPQKQAVKKKQAHQLMLQQHQLRKQQKQQPLPQNSKESQLLLAQQHLKLLQEHQQPQPQPQHLASSAQPYQLQQLAPRAFEASAQRPSPQSGHRDPQGGDSEQPLKKRSNPSGKRRAPGAAASSSSAAAVPLLPLQQPVANREVPPRLTRGLECLRTRCLGRGRGWGKVWVRPSP